VSFGLVKEIAFNHGAVSVTIQLTTNSAEAAQQIRTESERALKALPGINAVHIDLKQQPGAPVTAGQNPGSKQSNVPGVRHVVAVASGKGGVGKSTTSVN